MEIAQDTKASRHLIEGITIGSYNTFATVLKTRIRKKVNGIGQFLRLTAHVSSF